MAEKKSIDSILGKAKSSVTSTFAESERKKGGRPRKPESEHAKENRYAVYFSPSELAIVESAANSYGMTVGKFIKMAIVRMAKLDK
ncbi:hypothetical protein [Sulfurospirillum diekertiae]|uniref:Uncharacterized protein n=1 Tax=Sulfurospirillum diekertiae TaxID=1854492 RepID=A0A1Y0HJA4_9BACT|nr:hypothetical protein [Sulfurospirillum diekertiae]ARU48132.1 hypothetical protein Sdiek1_0966 [Sulfurospirillum diekertiae]ASC92975.1 hypothetical protein Sdiek2_0954 [Sulfurospirillum diekertiae]